MEMESTPNSLVEHTAEQLQTGEDLPLGHGRLDDRRHHGDPDVLGCDVVRRRHGGDVDVYEGRQHGRLIEKSAMMTRAGTGLTVLPADLVLGDDDLRRIRVVGTRYGVLEDTDRPDHLAGFYHPHLSSSLLELLARSKVAGITNDLLRAHRLSRRGDAGELAGLGVDVDRLDLLVEHVGASVDGREAGERLGQLAETVERVDVGRLAVPRHGLGVEDDSVDRGPGGLGLVAEKDVSMTLIHR
jgi:hypothetical protein